MANESVHKTLALAKNGDAAALEEIRTWKKNQRETGRRVEELKLRLMQLTERNWDQSISIIKNWLDKA